MRSISVARIARHAEMRDGIRFLTSHFGRHAPLCFRAGVCAGSGVPNPTYDIAVIGGGLCASALARDAAGRGLSVFLCEQGDLGGGSSSNTGRLLIDSVPGSSLGLGMLRSIRASGEAAALHRAAPHVARPLTMMAPRAGGVRAQLRRLGLHLHGRLSGAQPIRNVALGGETALGRMFDPAFRFAESLPTFAVDDARLVLLTALDAKLRGAEIHVRTRCVEARRESWFWKLSLESTEGGEPFKIVARTLVNATGAVAGPNLGTVVRGVRPAVVPLVKRSYAILRGRFGDEGFALADPAGATIFMLPYEQDYTLVGPIDTPFDGPPAAVPADRRDVVALLAALNAFLRDPVGEDRIAWTFTAVIAEPGAVEPILAEIPDDLAPVVTVLDGGGLAGHRACAEAVLDRLKGVLAVRKPWTLGAPLPGGSFAPGDKNDIVRALRAAYPFVAEIDAERMVGAYGTRAAGILSGARRAEDLGTRFPFGMTEAEVRYLMDEEFARTAGDVLWRRSKLGLGARPADAMALDAWMTGARMPAAAASSAA
jgi:glycerol-3-phosphate dehydrogenase